MAYDGAGSLFALGARLTKLNADGTPMTGAGNSYTTEALITVNFGLEYSEPNAIETRNGKGEVCVYYAPSRTLLRGTIEELRVCTPDPYVTSFLIGGDVITTGGTDEAQTITITGTPTGGDFTLSYDGDTTDPIAYDAAAADVQAALLALDSISTGEVTVTGGPGPDTPWVATFGGGAGSTDVAEMTATGNFTGGTTPAIAVTTTTAGVAGETAIGWRAPRVNVDPTPNGVAIEAWSRAVLDNAFAASLPYFQWVVPRARLSPSQALTLGAEDPATPSFTGQCEQNANFGDGPANDIDFPTDRVWQYCRVGTIPTLTGGLTEVQADA
jgi:hypothetical protein